MASKTSTALPSAIRRILRPMLRLLIEKGWTWKDFAEIVKEEYAFVARNEFTLDGKKMSDSRVAILTGITRKELLKMRRTSPENDLEESRYHRGVRVVRGWCKDSDFSKNGKPSPLPQEGEGSFAELVKRHGADVPYRAMLDEFVRIGMVEIHPKNRLVRLKQNAYLCGDDTEQGVDILGREANALFSSVLHNLHCGNESDKYLQRSLVRSDIPAEWLPELRMLAKKEGQKFLEALDSSIKDPQHDMKKNNKRIRVGVYYHEEA